MENTIIDISPEVCIAHLCDQITKDGSMDDLAQECIKTIFYRIIVPKDHWSDCSQNKFINLTLQKYREAISEE